jgi:hypothetical protein
MTTLLDSTRTVNPIRMRRRVPGEARPTITDRRWASEGAPDDPGHTTEPTPLDMLEASAPFDLDAPAWLETPDAPGFDAGELAWLRGSVGADWDRLAGEAAAVDRMERGLFLL